MTRKSMSGETWHEPSANDRQVGGDHYKRAKVRGGEEHWDRVVTHELDYHRACATGYIERCWEKYGVQDLEKAIHFLEKAIEIARAQGRRGKMEDLRESELTAAREEGMKEALRVQLDLDTVLAQRVVTATGMVEINGRVFQCLKGGPFDFTREGGTGARDEYTCRHCRERVYVPCGDLPWAHHRCDERDGSGATRAYVAQGAEHRGGPATHCAHGVQLNFVCRQCAQALCCGQPDDCKRGPGMCTVPPSGA